MGNMLRRMAEYVIPPKTDEIERYEETMGSDVDLFNDAVADAPVIELPTEGHEDIGISRQNGHIHQYALQIRTIGAHKGVLDRAREPMEDFGVEQFGRVLPSGEKRGGEARAAVEGLTKAVTLKSQINQKIEKELQDDVEIIDFLEGQYEQFMQTLNNYVAAAKKIYDSSLVRLGKTYHGKVELVTNHTNLLALQASNNQVYKTQRDVKRELHELTEDLKEGLRIRREKRNEVLAIRQKKILQLKRIR